MTGDHVRRSAVPPEVLDYYTRHSDAGRLLAGQGALERVRTQELIERHLPPPPEIILDVGGAAGVYAHWLTGKGYRVHLVDPVATQVREARAAAAGFDAGVPVSLTVGCAEHLPYGDGSAATVLLLGPLYHLTERDARLAALREAHRVLRAGGILFAAAISHFASLFDGLVRGFLADSEFGRIVQRDLAEGQHRNPTGRPEYFTTAYFHRPEELRAEVEEAGFVCAAVRPVEGPLWLLGDFEARWADPALRERLLALVRRVECEESLLAVSPHLLALGRKT